MKQAKTFVWSLLGDRHRRIDILMHWHEKCPSKDTTLREVWKKFVSILLYHKLDVCLDSNGIYLFGTRNGIFTIQYNWLNHQEKVQLNYFVQNRKQFFPGIQKNFHGDQKILSGFIGNKNALTKVMRKQILRDFCSLVYQITPPLRLCLYFILLDLSIAKGDTVCLLLAKTLIGYTPDGPDKTPINDA